MPTVLDASTIHAAQLLDDKLEQIISQSSLDLQELSLENTTVFCDVSTGVVRPYLPLTLRRLAFDIIHGPSHPSGRVTARTLAEKFIWPGIRKDAIRWARECVPCQRSKISRHNKTIPHHIEVPGTRFNHIHFDIISLPTVNDFKYCLTIVDRFTRWPQAIPMKDMLAETVAREMYNHWVCQYGTPITITSDQGKQFEAELFKALGRLVGLSNKIRTTGWHPQSNGMCERMHRTLKAALMCHNDVYPWIEILPTVLLGLRTAYKPDLGASPAEMLYGATIRIPGEFFVTRDLPVNPSTFLQKIRAHFQALKPVPSAHHTHPKHFVFKDLATSTHVFRRVDGVKPMLTPPYTGPHKVIRRLDEKRYVIDQNGIEKTVSTEQLKPAYLEYAELIRPIISTDQSQPQTSTSKQIVTELEPQQPAAPRQQQPATADAEQQQQENTSQKQQPPALSNAESEVRQQGFSQLPLHQPILHSSTESNSKKPTHQQQKPQRRVQFSLPPLLRPAKVTGEGVAVATHRNPPQRAQHNVRKQKLVARTVYCADTYKNQSTRA